MSVLTSRTGRTGHTAHRRPVTIISLAVLLGLLTVGAVQGGVAMVLDPIEPLGMSVDFLEGTPVDDYFWPGIFLLGIALGSILAVIGLLGSWEWKWAQGAEMAIGYRWPWVAAMIVGGLLLLFEIIELFMVPFHPVMHPLLIGAALAIIGLALSPSARSEFRVDR